MCKAAETNLVVDNTAEACCNKAKAAEGCCGMSDSSKNGAYKTAEPSVCKTCDMQLKGAVVCRRLFLCTHQARGPVQLG